MTRSRRASGKGTARARNAKGNQVCCAHLRPKTAMYPAINHRIKPQIDNDKETPGNRKARPPRSTAGTANSSAGRKSKAQVLEILDRSAYCSQTAIPGTSRI